MAWLQSQPLDLATIEAKVSATLRAERLARLNYLRQLAGRGKLAAQLHWIEDFTASGEPLVVFADHIEIQRRCSSASRTRSTCWDRTPPPSATPRFGRSRSRTGRS